MNDSPDGTSTHPFEQGSGPAATGAGFLAQGSMVAGRYEVRGVLGVGGYAIVYRCWDRELRREAALKLLTRVSEEAAARLRREVALGSGWENPNLLRLYDFGTHEGQPFCTMPVADGGTLALRLEKHGAIPFSDSLPLVEQLLEGLAYLHGKGFVHRDVKPSNVFFDSEGKLRLGDFGIVLDPSATRYTIQGQTPGTPFYMAPEFITGQEPKASADIWSAGLTIKDMLRGPHAAAALPELPKWFARWLDGMGQHDPSRRFTDAGAALDALRKKKTPPHIMRSRLAAAALLLAASLGAGGAWFAWHRATASSREAISLKADGERVTAYDASGGRIWSASFPAPVDDARPFDTSQGGLHRFIVTYGGPGGRLNTNPGRPGIALLSTRGEILADLDPLKAFNPFGTPFPESQFDPVIHAIEDLEGDGHPEAIVQFGHGQYPNLLYVISAKEGRCLGAFANSGHIQRILIPPHGVSSEHPRRPIFFTGMNNRMGHQAFASCWTGGEGFLSSPDLDWFQQGGICVSYRPLGAPGINPPHPISVDRYGTLSLETASGGPLSFTALGLLSTDAGFAANAFGEGQRLERFYLDAQHARFLLKERRMEEGLPLARQTLAGAMDDCLKLYVQVDVARTLREAGMPGAALEFLPEDPDRCANPGSVWLQRGELLVLNGRYGEGKTALLRTRDLAQMNYAYGFPGYATALLLEGASPEEAYRSIGGAYSMLLGTPTQRAWVLLSGALNGESSRAFEAAGRMNIPVGGERVTYDEFVRFPLFAPIWRAFAELDAGREVARWTEEKEVRACGEEHRMLEYRFVEAFRAYREKGGAAALPALKASYGELLLASRREAAALVPFTLAAYHCGFAAAEAGDRKVADEALRHGLRMYPRGKLAERARKLLR